MRLARKFGEYLVIHAIHVGIMRKEFRCATRRGMRRDSSGFNAAEVIVSESVVPNCREQGKKVTVILAVLFGEIADDEV